MRKLPLLIVLFFSTLSYGQFAIVSDKDGSAYVRDHGEYKGKIIDSLKDGHMIYCMDIKGNWTNIDYTKKDNELSGYIYKDRYRFVSTFSAIPIVLNTPNKVKLKKDSIEIILTQSRFEKNKHKFKYIKEYPDQIELIDNKKYWGMDGGMPTEQFNKIIVKIGSKTIILPKVATNGLYQPNLGTAEIHFDKQTNTIYIETMNSDGAGGYEVIWKVENGVYKDRLVAYGF